MNILLFAGGGALIGASAITIVLYNRLARQRIKAREALSGINIQLERRHEHISGLEGVADIASDHEADLLGKLIAHNQADQQPGQAGNLQMESQLSKVVASYLSATAEGGSAKQSFAEIRTQLATIEEDLQMARRYYNALVRDYNSSLETFPSLVIATLLNFKPMDYFSEQGQSQASQF